jgi:hypothetical protein
MQDCSRWDLNCSRIHNRWGFIHNGHLATSAADNTAGQGARRCVNVDRLADGTVIGAED